MFTKTIYGYFITNAKRAVQDTGQCRCNNNWAGSFINYFQRKYIKIRQIGDPVLRNQAKPVELPHIIDPDFKVVVDQLVFAMRKHNGYGLAAPQLGVSLQVIALEVTSHDLKMAMNKYGSKGISKMQMALCPLTVLINPRIKIVDSNTVTLRESCLSMEHYSAMVPRAKEIAVEALNVKGETVNFNAVGWTARIIQHEMDHLKGNLFIDSMTYKTLTYEKWNNHKI